MARIRVHVYEEGESGVARLGKPIHKALQCAQEVDPHKRMFAKLHDVVTSGGAPPTFILRIDAALLRRPIQVLELGAAPAKPARRAEGRQNHVTQSRPHHHGSTCPGFI